MTAILVVALAVAACGAQVRGVEWRIIGGNVAAGGAYPFQISLRYNGWHYCSGSIIDDTTILTAAHCTLGIPEDELTIFAGTNQINSRGVSYKLLEIRVHEDFVSTFEGDDIAILKVDPITFNDKVQPIELETEILPGDVNCTTSGWGFINSIGVVPIDLQEVHLKTVTNEFCKKALALATFPWIVTDKSICTFTKIGEGLCLGDSGGPLISNNKLVGIVSGGEPCGVGFPDIFPRISSYLEWIANNRL